MLGRAADAFYKIQSRERIVSQAPNGDGRSIDFPDRENAGTGKVTRVNGSYEMPGPNTVVDANTMMPVANASDMLPGMGNADMLPGMGNADMLPGMGAADMLPGMGFLPSGRTLLIGGLIAAGAFFLMRKKKSA